MSVLGIGLCKFLKLQPHTPDLQYVQDQVVILGGLMFTLWFQGQIAYNLHRRGARQMAETLWIIQ